ncbi:MAG: hypothetical protein K8T26_10920 [Lentisphaerae bacterium]|nr:hypothetical protein [Lentisphaerota bacterium]
MSTGDVAILQNMSAPSRTEVKSVQVAADGQPVIFSTAHACLAAGLVDAPGVAPRDWRTLLDHCHNKWQLSDGSGLLLADLAAHGITTERVDARAGSIRGSAIGWPAYHIEGQTARLKENLEQHGVGFCTDLELTLAVLSRCVAWLFLPRRSPDYSAMALFRIPFCVCDRRFTAPGLKQAPWRRLAVKGGAT